MAITNYKYLKNNIEVSINVDECGCEVTVKGPNQIKIGSMSFKEIDFGVETVLLISWAHLEGADKKFLRQGIGRECLMQVREQSGMNIYAHAHDGVRREDGSHLTGDAPVFVDRMVTEGLISRN